MGSEHVYTSNQPATAAPGPYLFDDSCTANGGVPEAVEEGCWGIISAHALSGAPVGYPTTMFIMIHITK